MVTDPNDSFGFPKIPVVSMLFLFAYIVPVAIFDVSDFEQFRILVHAVTQW